MDEKINEIHIKEKVFWLWQGEGNLASGAVTKISWATTPPHHTKPPSPTVRHEGGLKPENSKSKSDLE